MVISTPSRTDLAHQAGPAASGAALGLLIVPGLMIGDGSARARLLLGIVAIAIAALFAWWTSHAVARPRLAWLGGLAALLALWLTNQRADPGTVLALSALFGGGLGLFLMSRPERIGPVGAVSAAVSMIVMLLWHASRGRTATLQLAALAVVILAVASVVRSFTAAKPATRSAGATVWVIVVLGLIAAFATMYIGANDADAAWFGNVITHGDRHKNEVALTFDDGPSVWTLPIAQVLDHYGVKGTFFSVGKAVAARPDITQTLAADGHLIANHSYHHDSWRWLDPRYPELAKTDKTISARIGQCPAFYRPPHGQHTPFMAHVVDNAGMKMVTWDTSAGDFATKDANKIAQRILATVKPGSIIDLHDGLDGNVQADRSVLVRALPLILDGLRAKGLQPVRLDQLLGTPGYISHC
jgi:peptidoglycan/xylan/chitin deacetylase (PgdA/CDA1 family)